MKRFFGLLALIVSFCLSARAQVPCPQSSGFNGKLACTLPYLYGPAGPSGAFSAQGVFGNTAHQGHFDNSIGLLFGALNSDISRQVSLLPTVSPGSGFSLVFDPSLKTFVTTTDSLGPIIGQRADTIGRHRVSFGVSYQFFQFDKLDGTSLSDVPITFTHADDVSDFSPPGVTCSSSTTGLPNQNSTSYRAAGGAPTGGCSFVRDRIDTRNSINLKVHQVVAYLTFGLTRNIDVSVVIPYENVRFGVTSAAQIVTGSYLPIHFFKNGCILDPGNTSPLPATGNDPSLTPCFNETFPNAVTVASKGSPASSSASGIGDVTVRLKAAVWRGEKASVAAGVDVRFPTGDALNYLGSGAYGIKPFAIASYHARVAPHAMIGMEANGFSVTSGDVTQGTKAQLPNDLTYDVGVDAYATKRLTGAFDIVGQRVFDAPATAVVSQPYLAPCVPQSMLIPRRFDPNATPDFSGSPAACGVIANISVNPTITPTFFSCGPAGATDCPTQGATITQSLTVSNTSLKSITKSYNITNASLGLKVALVKRLVLSLNVLIRLDDGGLHAKPAPMAALGYTF